MQVRELIELGALVAVHGPVFLRHESPLVARHVGDYWTAGKCRLDRWKRALGSSAERLGQEDDALHLEWRRTREVLEEVLASELLTRVWTAVATSYDRRHQAREIEPLVRSVFCGHLEARHRALHILLVSKGVPVAESVELNRLRRRLERWTDKLLAFLGCDDACEYAHQPDRAREFAQELAESSQTQHAALARSLLLGSFAASFERELTREAANVDLNRQIGSHILGCFRTELFDSMGLLQSLWMMRLNQMTLDTEDLIQSLLTGLES